MGHDNDNCLSVINLYEYELRRVSRAACGSGSWGRARAAAAAYKLTRTSLNSLRIGARTEFRSRAAVMSWDSYISSLTKSEWVDDAVIIGHAAGQESVWASTPGGWLCKVTPAEVQAIVANDRSTLFANGVSLAGRKCTVLRDTLNVDGQNTLDVKMKTSEKEPEPFSITIGKSQKALIIAKGVKDAHGGKINPPVFDMAAYLRKMNM